MNPGFPRYFRIAGYWVSAYKVFLCLGIYSGVLLSAAVAQHSGLSPLSLGLGCLLCAMAGLVGARVYHLLLFFRSYPKRQFWREAWNPQNGGWSIFGALVIIPFSILVAKWIRIPLATFWDHMVAGIICGAVWVRCGCICNGCCGGRVTKSRLGLCQHDILGVRQRRIPVQSLEIIWWALAGVGLICLWPKSFSPGSYALGVLAWYGLGRFWLETLRASPDQILGGLRVNQLVAALLMIAAGTGLFLLTETSH